MILSFLPGSLFVRAQHLQEGIVFPRGIALRGLTHRIHNSSQIADQAEIEVAIVADVSVIHVHDHDLGFWIQTPPVAHAEIQRRAGQ